MGKRLVQSGADLKALDKEALQQLLSTMGGPAGEGPGPRELHPRAVGRSSGSQRQPDSDGTHADA